MAIAAVVASTVVSAGVSYFQGQSQKRQQEKQLAMQRQANADARKRADEAKQQSEIAMNKANPKRADVSALSSKEQQAALVGSGGTLLTGNQGVEIAQENLGGNTLLGA
jgi:hypothetical protein